MTLKNNVCNMIWIQEDSDLALLLSDDICYNSK